ncbi:hypothetical protein IW140_004277 [Coemansia sp. RSA 1813]|nr:hypothetical protein EV178_004364 [Coemansia sp. RSA 1646]KAJ1769985.1 hypothetical protein LPJ74_003559 [Coemansia sp. RSA 1843]KAJ2088109.1 hypothetical protein IW138_004448 [Coemansia sp. RSA 986]KAJ2214833.1 hypothetical protein EV179_002643 [Coemansia sp. RSA 487]KAJ2567842.1 hypothetical protein IW140_004277 [Coemansia sp. RSA 1813]
MTSGNQDGSGNSAVSAAAAAVAVAAAAAAAAGTPISNSTHWSTEETKLLIKTWGEHRDEFAEIKRNLSVWNKVLERLLTAGFFRTVEQCRNRWKFLETKYRTAFKEIDEKGRTPWEFFEDMDMAKRGVDSPQPRDYHQSKRFALEASPSSQKSRRLSPISVDNGPPMFTDAQGRVHLPPIHTPSNAPAFGLSSGPRESPPHMHSMYHPQQPPPPPPPPPSHQHHQQQQQQQQHSQQHHTQQLAASPMQGGGASMGRHLSAMPSASAPQMTSRHMHQYSHAARTQPLHPTTPSRSMPSASLRTSYIHPYQHHRHARTSSADNMRSEYIHEAYPPPSHPPQRTIPAADDAYIRPTRLHSNAATTAAAILTGIDDPNERDHPVAGTRKRNRSLHHRTSISSTDNTLDDSTMPTLPPGIDKVELTGTVRRTDLLEFLRELSKLREHREAIRIEERKRYEEMCSTEEWRFHEFQMSLVNMAQSSLAPHAIDTDGSDIDNRSPCISRTHCKASSVANSQSGSPRPRAPSTNAEAATRERITFVAEPAEAFSTHAATESQGSNHSSSGTSEEGEVVERDETIMRSRVRTPSSSFGTAHLSAAIARAGTRSSLRRTGSSDAELETNNRHISSTSSSPLEVRPTKA